MEIQYEGRYGQSAAAIADGASHLIYVIGGAVATGKYHRDIITFDFATRASKQLTNTTNLDLGRNFHSVISHNKKLYIFGGKSNGYFNDVLKFDPKENNWERLITKGTPPSKRYGHSACLWGNKMVIFGGYDDEGQSSNELFSLDLVDLQWELIRSVDSDKIPSARFHHTCAIHHGTMYLFGGRDADNHIWAFDMKTKSWHEIRVKSGAKPAPRYAHSMHVIGGETLPMLLIFGGTDGHEEFNQLWCFNLNLCQIQNLYCDYTWTNVFPKKEGPSPRYFHSSIVHEGSLVLFGGRNSETSAMNDFTELPLRINFSAQIPEEIWLKIFTWLDLASLGRICRTSKAVRRISGDGELWKNMCVSYGAVIDREAPKSANYKRWLRVVHRKKLLKWRVDKDGELAQGLPIKITIVGENKVGKSSFSVRFASKTFPSPEEYLPVAMEPIEGKGLHSGHEITYSLWDIRATHEYETLRVKSYFGTDVFLMMFSLVAPSSLKLIEEYWDAEVTAQIPDAIKILVGTKEDLVTHDDTLQKLADNHLHPVTHDEAMKVARKIGAAEYFKISSRMGTNVEQLMQRALHLASERMLKDMEPYDLDEDQKKRCAVM